MWVQTWHPRHALYAALRQHDFAAFAASQLKERETAGLPPFAHLAMLRADAQHVDAAHALPATPPRNSPRHCPGPMRVMVYPPVPLAIARVADVERMQMLVESASRPALQRFLAAWLPALHADAARTRRRRRTRAALGGGRRPARDLIAVARRVGLSDARARRGRAVRRCAAAA